jgi:hypothetical protein
VFLSGRPWWRGEGSVVAPLLLRVGGTCWELFSSGLSVASSVILPDSKAVGQLLHHYFGSVCRCAWLVAGHRCGGRWKMKLRT